MRRGGTVGPVLVGTWVVIIGAMIEPTAVPAQGAGGGGKPGDAPPAGTDRVPAMLDSVVALPDSVAALPDSVVAAADSLRPPPPLPDRIEIPGVDAPAVVGVPLEDVRIAREEVERAGARTPFQVLSYVAHHHAPEVSSTVEIGGLAVRGSYGAAAVDVDGWAARLPRMEGRDLSAMLFDRIGPHAGYASYASVGSLSVATAPPFAPPGRPRITLTAVEPAAPVGARSRVSVYRGGYDLIGGGLTLYDRRGRFDYGIGVTNAHAGRSGAVETMDTRLVMIDLGWALPAGRIEVSTRSSERDLTWKHDELWNQDNQGMRVAAILGDSVQTEWRLQTTVLDDRLSGSEVPGLEYLRKGWGIELGATHRGEHLFWGNAHVERDWLELRSQIETAAPRVERAWLDLGGATALGGGVLNGSLATRWSSEHPPRPGGGLEWRRHLGVHDVFTIGVSRHHRAPTMDQEVLAIGDPVAEPERADAGGLQLEHAGRWSWSVGVWRRHLGHVPSIIETAFVKPWPLYTFNPGESAHWEVRGGILTPPWRFWQLRAGAWGSLLEIDGDPRWAPQFVPRYTGRAYLTADLTFFGGDLRLRPRLDANLIGERWGFDGVEHEPYGRLDGTLIAVMSEAADLELSIRNLTDHRYELAVIDPTTGTLYRDSGRMTVIGLRWKLLD